MSSKHWKSVTLGDICQIIIGGTPSTNVPEFWANEIKWVTAKDVSDSSGYRIYDTDRKISKLGFESCPAKMIPSESTILIARGATMGKSCMLGEEMAVNQTCYALVPDQKYVDPYYLFYSIKLLHSYFNRVSNGAIFNTVIGSGLRETEIDLPPLPTQRRIADILSALDDKIELNRQTSATLEAIAQAIFKEWFVDFNFPGATGEMQESELGLIPAGWNVGLLGEIYRTTSGGTPSRENLEYYEGGTIQWVKSKEINGSFIIDTEEKITQEALKRSAAKLLPAYSVLIAMYGATVGQYGITSAEAACNQAICAFLPSEEYPFTFAFHILKNNKDEIVSRAVGSAQQNISQTTLKQFEVILPPVQLIRKFHRTVHPLFESIENNIRASSNLEHIRDVLLPELMNGKVLV